ncbi:MAG: Uma2 family endonuclease [Rhodospirillales bacterium]|nr:Uma2 family endonuclease [Rhodospirillales bacterium]
MSLPDPAKRYSVEDYLSWPKDVACELIQGAIHEIPSAPTEEHENALIAIGSLLVGYIRAESSSDEQNGDESNPCAVFVEPVDVVLASDTVVQPDITVVCDHHKLANDRYVDGAPDLVVEVLTPETADWDRNEKRAAYERAGVTEYVIVAPATHTLEVYLRQPDGRYGEPDVLGPADDISFLTIPGLEASIADVFGWPLPQET